MREKGTRIYVMVVGEFCKVGISKDPGARRCNLQSANPYRIDIHWVSSPMKPGEAYDAEQAAHEILGDARTTGEWFAVEPDAAVAAVMEAMASETKRHPRAHRNPRTVSGLIHGETAEEWLASYNRGPQPGDWISGVFTMAGDEA